jgi:hypothetical protein
LTKQKKVLFYSLRSIEIVMLELKAHCRIGIVITELASILLHRNPHSKSTSDIRSTVNAYCSAIELYHFLGNRKS